jgi:von Willebrand factor type A domain
MRRVSSSAIALSSLFPLLLAACSDDTPPEPASELEPPPGVEVVVYEELQLTDDARLPEQWPRFSRADVLPDRVIFSFDGGLPNVFDIAVGNIIAGQSGGGYLRRVLAVHEQGERLVVDTASATLVELIARGHFEASFDPDGTQWNEVPRVGKLPLISRIVEDFECSVGQLPLAQMGVYYETRLDFHLEIEIADGKLEQATFTTTGGQEISAELEVDAAFQASCTRSLLGEVDREWSTFIPVGFLPIPVTHTLSPSAELDVSGSMGLGRVLARTRAGYQLTAGAEYVDGAWRGLWAASATGDATLDKEEGGLSLNTGITAGVDYTIKLFDVAGPRVGLSASAEAGFSLESCEFTTEVQAGLNGTIGAALDIPVLDDTIAEIEISRELRATVVDARSGIQLGCEDSRVDDIQPVSASGDFDERGGVLEVAVSPTDAEGNFIGHELSAEHFAFTGLTMTPESGFAPIPLTTIVERVEVDEPDPGASMTAVMVFDSSGSMSSNDPGAIGRRAGAQAFFRELDMADSVAVLDFGAGVTAPLAASRLLQDFTPDSALLEASLDQLTEFGGTPLYDSLLDAVGLLESRGPGGVIVVLTDGQDADSLASSSAVIGQAAAHGVQIL